MPKIADGDSELKTDELAWNMKKQSVEICGIQEHRQVHETDRIDDINCYKVGLGYELYTASAWRNTMQAATGGVGIVIGKIAQRALIGVDRISDRLIKATFQGNPALTVIVAYAPCEYAASTDKTDFNDNLRQAIEAVPRHHFLVVLGDLNARLGPDDVLFTCNDQTNDNGRRLLDVMEEYQLLATHTLFQKRKGKLWT
ncbi:craniofacial development protein 2-like [Diadema antillarum]|uniref:craniofacial development protein 2-like n=1 Tax=Diadema antillarum TaxID=105358 RepID=UPI003A8B6347